MSIDRRNKMLKLLRQTNYEVFEKACKELGVEYTIPPLHAQKVHRRILAKKALCIRVRISTVGCFGRSPWTEVQSRREKLSVSDHGLELARSPAHGERMGFHPDCSYRPALQKITKSFPTPFSPPGVPGGAKAKEAKKGFKSRCSSCQKTT